MIVFGADYYLAKNPDVAFARADPFTHFLLFGFREGRDPSPDFDVSWYLAVNGDVATSGINPLVHYNDFGRFEGRAPSSEPIGVRALVVKDITVNEDDGKANFVITRTGGSLGSITLDYKTTPKTAADGVDYIGVSGSLTFKPGESTKTVTVTLIKDGAPEPDETFGFEIANVQGSFFDAGASRLKATATLTERTIPLVSVADVTVNEDARIAAVTITRARDGRHHGRRVRDQGRHRDRRQRLSRGREHDHDVARRDDGDGAGADPSRRSPRGDRDVQPRPQGRPGRQDRRRHRHRHDPERRDRHRR
ncbi:MAG: hypothetical protein FJX67_17920 [Alphaproteobacteria bacterium]|nr:hypothetical protein [Alphaproteobacteria bacterium]